ncbi:MAG: glycosyltransferase family 4 protein [Lentisphaeria bacterium]
MKQILYICEYAGFVGGIEQYALDTAKLLRKNGYEVSLFYEKKAKDFEPFCEAFSSCTQKLENLSDFELVVIHKCKNLKILRTLVKNCGSHLAAVVHDHDLYCPRKYFYRPFHRRNCSLPYSYLRCGVCSMTISPRRYSKGIFHELFYKFWLFPKLLKWYRKIPTIIVLSEFMRKNLLRNQFSSQQVHVIHPFISVVDDIPKVSEKHFKKGAVPTIGFVGQLIRGKGCDLFLRMLQKMKMPYRAVIAGTGNDEVLLHHIAEEENLPVKFCGFVKDVQSFYSQCDFMVLPFRWQEPFGLVGIEAAANHLPVVAYDVGGISEWLKLDELLVPYLNEEKLLKIVGKLIKSPALCVNYGEKNASVTQEHFSSAEFIKKMDQLLLNL